MAENWRGTPDMHPATFIQEEMDALNWTRDRMSAAMAMHSDRDASFCRLKLDLYLDVGPSDARLRLGDTGREISLALGLSEGFFNRLEAAWLSDLEGK